MRITRAFLVAGSLSVVSTAVAALSESGSGRRRLAAVTPEQPVRVRLYDPYRLLGRETRGWVEREVKLAFRRSGLEVRFVTGGGGLVVPATLYPAIPDRWGVSPDAIGVAIGSPGERRSVFLSVETAKRAIGWSGIDVDGDGGAQRPGERRRLGVAIGRVLAHEITHTIAPDCPHTETGLMAKQLNRKMLTAPGVGFDETATRHLQRSAETFGAPQNG